MILRPALRASLLAAVLLALGACSQEKAESLTPRDLTPETLGHYCQMNLLEHPGPKAQIFLDKNPDPIFFSQVRDAIAYERAPEQVAPIAVAYVNDMGKPGASWEKPGDGNWIRADKAFYVVGSSREGGMGAPETVPFSSRDSAEAFARAEGGRVLTLADIPDSMVLAPVETGPKTESDDRDYLNRLNSLPRKAGD